MRDAGVLTIEGFDRTMYFGSLVMAHDAPQNSFSTTEEK